MDKTHADILSMPPELVEMKCRQCGVGEVWIIHWIDCYIFRCQECRQQWHEEY